MPVSPSYPGVYVEDIPSGVHTITGVSTSVTAFVGRTARGPVNEPATVTSVADYERIFGPLDIDYPVGFSVRDFYLNGGAIAIIIRVFKGTADAAEVSAFGLNLAAASPGEWGKQLRARVKKSTAGDDVAKTLGPGIIGTDLFNLTLHDGTTDTTETFINLTAVPSARNVTDILASQSTLARTKGTPATPTDEHKDTIPTGKKTVWDNDDTSTGASANPDAKDSATLADAADFGDPGTTSGFYALAHADLFNLLVMPLDELGDNAKARTLNASAAAYCRERRALYIVDSPADWKSVNAATTNGPTALGILDLDAQNAALYFPRVRKSNPLHGDQIEEFPPSGMIAGVMARTDVTRGVWKAPAGVEAALFGAQGLSVTINDRENGLLNPLGINCLRTLPRFGNIVWGARTLRGADALGDDYKYVPVRRTALFIEESLCRGLKWVVFEPNDDRLWGQIRLNVGAFMQGLFRQGALQGSSARDAYFVACDGSTTTQDDIDLGVVNVVVGFAPLKPAEFLVLKIQQLAGQIQT
jgi:phage tail sheath protein FI